MRNFFKFTRWLYPGLKIKRWVFFIFLSLIIILLSSPHIKDNNFIVKIASIVSFIIGIFVLFISILFLLKSFFEVIYPYERKDLIDIIYEKRLLSKGPKIVAIGGGTGLSTILRGLKEYTLNISAIVAVADEGGSSGRLRQEFGILPPGDIRNCLVALAEADKLMQDLFQYRFKEGDGIKGHSFGNLFITAMTQITGSFKDAVEESSRVLAIRGRVIPSSLEKIRLKAEYTDGTFREGEDKISDETKTIKRVYLIPQDARPNPEAIEAIRNADLIILGPGSLFTSIIPNLLIKEISEEIAKKNVLKIYICNVMTQHGETDGFTASDHLSMLISHSKKEVVNCCLVNSGRLEYNLLLKYSYDKSFPVIFDRDKLKKIGVLVFEADVVSKTNYLHHDFLKTAKEIINIYRNYKNYVTN